MNNISDITLGSVWKAVPPDIYPNPLLTVSETPQLMKRIDLINHEDEFVVLETMFTSVSRIPLLRVFVMNRDFPSIGWISPTVSFFTEHCQRMA